MNIRLPSNKENTKLPQVMRAALRLFVARGIDGTTIKDIARAARVAEGALYRHFKSKEDLAWHLFRVNLHAFSTELSQKVFAQATAKARVRVFVEESFAAFEEDRDLFTYLILREHSELEKYAQTHAHPGHIVRRVIEEGQKSGEIRAGEPYILASLFVGSVIRICVVRMYGDLKRDLKNYSQETAGAIWDMLKAKS